MKVIGIFNETGEAALLEFLRSETPKMSTLRRVLVTPEGTNLLDVNRTALSFPGISYGHPLLASLLREVGASFDPESLLTPPPNEAKLRDFIISARYPWAHDRIA